MVKYKIFVLDDSKTFLAYIESILNYPEIELKLSKNPKDFEVECTQFNPDIILTDLEMPDLSGLDICKICKANSQLQTIPIIILTSTETDSKLIAAFNYGAHDYVNKNIHPAILLNKVISIAKYKHMINEQIKKENREIVKSLVATMNHEVNNAMCIASSMTLKVVRSTTDDQSMSYLQRVQAAHERIMNVMKKLNKLEEMEQYKEHNVSYLKI